jgi:DNA-binding Lrp family transcriptional regulator
VSDRKQNIVYFLEKHGQKKVSEFATGIGLSEGRVGALLHEMVSDGTIEKSETRGMPITI